MLLFIGLIFFFFYLCGLVGFFYCFWTGSICFDFLFFTILDTKFGVCFVFDEVSFGFFSCVTFISFLVFFYTLFYMGGTISMRYFVLLVFMFVFSMALLIFAGNFFLVLLGWDGLGLVSFCLVIFYGNSGSLESGLVTVFSNRVGDVFFLFGFVFFFFCGSWMNDSFASLFFHAFCLVLICGCITKSAQIPFAAWLPAAMAAPTPVSSLVHSSTLVTAGVYVLIRFNFLFKFFMTISFKALFLFTMVLAGSIALLESDLKKVVAMSTLSQLGMMMFVLSIGLWKLTFIHMIIHAFFKSMLFLSTGSVMSFLWGSQDSRFIGNSYLSYATFLYFLVSCLCLSGFPFFIGFYSKDSIIFLSSFKGGLFFYFLFILGCIFTVMYSLRLISLSFCSTVKFNSSQLVEDHSFFLLPVLVLFFVGWILGGVLYWFYFLETYLFFSYWDLSMGVVVLLFGLVSFFLIRFFYFFFVFLSSLFFLRWLTFSFSSRSFKKMHFFVYDFSWMELFGGSGAFALFNMSNFFIKSVSSISLGSLFAFIFSVSVFFF